MHELSFFFFLCSLNLFKLYNLLVCHYNIKITVWKTFTMLKPRHIIEPDRNIISFDILLNKIHYNSYKNALSAIIKLLHVLLQLKEK